MNEPSRQRGRRGWCAVLAACVVVLLFCAVYYVGLPLLKRGREYAREAECAGHLKSICFTAKMYAQDEGAGKIPPLSNELGRWMMDYRLHDLYQGFPRDKCLSAPNAPTWEAMEDPKVLFDDHSYVYWCHLLKNDAEGVAYVEAIREALQAGGTIDDDLTASDGTVFERIRDDAESIDGVPSREIPIAMERIGRHNPESGIVLYLDGHVGHVPVGEFPMTHAFQDALASVE